MKRISFISMMLATLLLSVRVFGQNIGDLTELGSDVYLTEIQKTNEKKLHGFVGGFVFNSERLVGRDDRVTGVLPLLLMVYGDSLYWSIGGGGYRFYKSDDRRFQIGAALKFRRGYKTDDDAILQDMEERKTSVEGGLDMNWRTSVFVLGAAVYTDITNRSNGESASLRLSAPVRFSPNVKVTPSLGVEWLSDDLVDYYYGIRSTEATGSRPAYQGTSTVNSKVGLSVSYRIAKKWFILGGAGYTKLGDGIYNSPIVNNQGITTYYIGGGWVF